MIRINLVYVKPNSKIIASPCAGRLREKIPAGHQYLIENNRYSWQKNELGWTTLIRAKEMYGDRLVVSASSVICPEYTRIALTK